MSKSRFCPCLPGKCYSFLYPRHNYKGIPGKYEPRKLLVVSVRDLQKEALDASTAELNPTLIRGRWLVTGEDLDKGAERSFYVDSMKVLRELSPKETPQPQSCDQMFLAIDHGKVVHSTRVELNARLWLSQAGRGLLCKVLYAEVADCLREITRVRKTR